MFLFKKIVSPLLFPVPLCVEILGIGLILLRFSRKQKAGKILVSIGVGILLFLGNSRISKLLLRPLERQYPRLALSSDANTQTLLPRVRYIVVLSGGFSFDPRIPITSQVWSVTVVRLVEGILIYRELPGCKLILSGGPWPDSVPDAEGMAKFAQALGVSVQDIILEKESRDTEEQARLIKPLVGTEPFILVTSASHMPRAMGIFQHLGMKPTAAPTDYLATQNRRLSPDNFYPGSDGLEAAERAEHEYLGIAWEKLRGKL